MGGSPEGMLGLFVESSLGCHGENCNYFNSFRHFDRREEKKSNNKGTIRSTKNDGAILKKYRRAERARLSRDIRAHWVSNKVIRLYIRYMVTFLRNLLVKHLDWTMFIPFHA